MAMTSGGGESAGVPHTETKADYERPGQSSYAVVPEEGHDELLDGNAVWMIKDDQRYIRFLPLKKMCALRR